MIDGRSRSRQFRRTFTCLRYGPQALSGLRLLILFLSSVGKISRLYSAKSTLVSTVGTECCMSGSSVSTEMTNHLKGTRREIVRAMHVKELIQSNQSER